MKRPAFQFYPADWRANAKLRRCSEAARGAWVDVLCLLHDSDEYGVIRWTLAEIARAAGVPVRLLKELAEKDVLKGGDKGCEAYTFTPRHAGRDGEPVELLPAASGPCWYCSRFVRDEYIRQKRGGNTQFSDTNQPEKRKPKSPPKPPFGDGPSTASSSSSSPPSEDTPLPPKGDGDPDLFEIEPTIKDNGRVLPDRWRNIPKQDRRNHRVLRNNKLMCRIGRWFNRKDTNLWTLAEGIALSEIRPDPEDVETLEAYYLAVLDKGEDYRRRDLITMLNNWNGELDRARIWKAENP